MNKRWTQTVTAAESQLGRLQLFAMQSTAELGGAIARALSQPVAAH